MSINNYRWIKVVGEDGTFYDYVLRNRKQHLEWLRDGGYYAVPVRASEVPPCRYRDFVNEYSYRERSRNGGEDFYLPSTEEDIEAMNAMSEEAEGYASPDDEYCVLPEYRDLWSDDPDWDGTVTRREIERLAREWGRTVEDLMEQVEDLR